MNNWLYSPTKLVGIAQMRADGQWEDHILPEPIKIAEGNSMDMYQRSEDARLYKFIPHLKENNLTWAINYIGADIVAKWTIRLK